MGVERGGSPNLRKSRSGLRGPGENPSPNTREKGPGRDPSPTRDSTFNKAEIGDDVERGGSPKLRKSRSGLDPSPIRYSTFNKAEIGDEVERGGSSKLRKSRSGLDPSPTRYSTFNNAEVVDDVERGGSPNLRKSRSGLQGHGENAPLNTREKGLGRDPSPTRYSTFNKAEIGDDVGRGGSPNLRKSRSGLRGP